LYESDNTYNQLFAIGQVAALLTTVIGRVDAVDAKVTGVKSTVDSYQVAAPHRTITAENGSSVGAIRLPTVITREDHHPTRLQPVETVAPQQPPSFDFTSWLKLGKTTLPTLFATFFHMALYEQQTNGVDQKIRDSLNIVKKIIFYMKLHLPINTTILKRVPVTSGDWGQWTDHIVTLGKGAASIIENKLNVQQGTPLYCYKAVKGLQSLSPLSLPRQTFIDNNLPQYTDFWTATSLKDVRPKRGTHR
jgi:hypothetical protein